MGKVQASTRAEKRNFRHDDWLGVENTRKLFLLPLFFVLSSLRPYWIAIELMCLWNIMWCMKKETDKNRAEKTHRMNNTRKVHATSAPTETTLKPLLIIKSIGNHKTVSRLTCGTWHKAIIWKNEIWYQLNWLLLFHCFSFSLLFRFLHLTFARRSRRMRRNGIYKWFGVRSHRYYGRENDVYRFRHPHQQLLLACMCVCVCGVFCCVVQSSITIYGSHYYHFSFYRIRGPLSRLFA